MPVVAQSEKQLIIDLFGNKPVIYDSNWYRTENNQLISVLNNSLKFIDLMNPEKFTEINIKSCDNALISKNGKNVILQFYNNSIAVYNDRELVIELEKVSMVDVSNYYCIYIVDDILNIYSFEEKKIKMQIFKKVKQVRCIGSICLIVIEEDKMHKLYIFKKDKFEILLELNNIYGIKCEMSKDQNNYLILIDVEYTNNSYFAESKLYYLRIMSDESIVLNNTDEQIKEENINLKENIITIEKNIVLKEDKIINLTKTEFIKETNILTENKNLVYDNKSNKTEKQNNKSNKKRQLEKQIIDKNENELVIIKECKDWKIMYFKNMNKVLHFGFINDKFHVSFGIQPAYLNLFSKDGKLIKEYKRIIRNRVLFTRDEKRIINAGFGNLSGNIQVLVNDISTCCFESLGSSNIEWMNNDTNLIVITESYLKFDNKVVMYDYYGRKIDERKFNILKKANVYGMPEESFNVEHQEIVQTIVSKYIPPHLKNPDFKIPNFSNIRKTVKKSNDLSRSKSTVKNKVNEIIRTKSVVEKELELCKKLSIRLNKGEDLTPEEETKVFSINKLKEELFRFNEKQTQN